MKVKLNVYRVLPQGGVIVTSLDMSSAAGYILVNSFKAEFDAPEVDLKAAENEEKSRRLAHLRAELAKLEKGE